MRYIGPVKDSRTTTRQSGGIVKKIRGRSKIRAKRAVETYKKQTEL